MRGSARGRCAVARCAKERGRLGEGGAKFTSLQRSSISRHHQVLSSLDYPEALPNIGLLVLVPLKQPYSCNAPEALPNILVLVPLKQPSSCNAHTFLLSVWQPKLYVGDLNLGVSGQCGYLLFTLNFGP